MVRICAKSQKFMLNNYSNFINILWERCNSPNCISPSGILIQINE